MPSGFLLASPALEQAASDDPGLLKDQDRLNARSIMHFLQRSRKILHLAAYVSGVVHRVVPRLKRDWLPVDRISTCQWETFPLDTIRSFVARTIL